MSTVAARLGSVTLHNPNCALFAYVRAGHIRIAAACMGLECTHTELRAQMSQADAQHCLGRSVTNRQLRQLPMDFAIRRVEHVIEARMDPVLEIAPADFGVAERKATNERLIARVYPAQSRL